MNRIKRFLLPALLTVLLTLTGCATGGEGGDLPEAQLSRGQAIEQVQSWVQSGKVKYGTASHPSDDSWVGVDTTAEDLPEIDKYPLSVEGSGDIVVEIFSSTEKSNAKVDGWMDAMARQFNSSGATVNGQRIAVSIRPITSGLAMDYITSHRYVPDAYSPANELWAPMIAAKGVQTDLIQQRLTGNTAGILMKKDVHGTFTKKYGDVTVPNVVEAVTAGDLRLGHTDPNQSSTGLNILAQEMLAMDSANPLSPAAIEAFRTFQGKVPPVSPTTAELSKVAARGLADAMIMESQAFAAEPALATDWVFTPVGVRHDSPLYALNGLSAEKTEVLQQFAAFTQTDAAQKAASSFGFNLHDDYAGQPNTLSSAQLSGMLDAWKMNKDAGVPVVSMFVVDRSGSMKGDKMAVAKQALRSSAEYVNPGNYVGLVSYGDDVTVDLPISEFTDPQRSKFVGAVNDLRADGGTATNSAIVAALDQMLAFDTGGQEVKFRIILLSDGMQTHGLDLNAALQVVGGLEVPVFGISFETDSELADLERLASVSESGYVITADSEDAAAKLKALARLNM